MENTKNTENALENAANKTSKGNSLVIVLIVLLILFILGFLWIRARRARILRRQVNNNVVIPTATQAVTPPVTDQSIESQLQSLDSDAETLNNVLNDQPIDVMAE